ncbi:MAG: hypothetical protein ACI3XH_05440 [Phascolarctobacterium sp.]
MRKYNHRLAAAKEQAKALQDEEQRCEICGRKSKYCISSDNETGHSKYCVCPSCFMWSDELPAVRARADKRPKPAPVASAGKVKTKRGK